MSRAAWAALALAAPALGPRVATAGPPATVEVVACPFTAEAIDRALARELVSLGRGDAAAPPATVTCGDAGVAQLVVASEPPIARAIDLGDVTAELAPRVVAVVYAAAVIEREATVPDAPATTSPTTTPPTPAATPAAALPATPEATPAAPSTVAPDPAAGFAPPRTDATATAAATVARRPRRPTLVHDRRLRLGVSARALTRSYRGSAGALWGAGLSAVIGPVAVGLVHARGSVDHPLGTLAPALTAVDVAVTVACTRADTTTCLAARVELGRGAIAASSTDPTVTGEEVGGLDAHAAAELVIARELGGLEVAGVISVGAGAGVIARANGAVAAQLAGVTLGAALEVRR